MANITHCRNMKLPPQTAGAASVIRNGNDRRQSDSFNFLKPAQDRRLSRSSPITTTFFILFPSYRDALYSSDTDRDNAHTANS